MAASKTRPPGSPRLRNPWTEEHIAHAADRNLSPRQVAELTGHSLKSVHSMRTKLNRGWQPGRRGWTDDEDDILRNAPHMTAQQIGEHVGRTASAVTQRRAYLGLSTGLANPWDATPWAVARRTLLARTCPACGLLLGAEWFGRVSQGSKRTHGYWWTECKRCRQGKSNRKHANRRRRPDTAVERRKAKEHRARMQALTMPYATRSGQPWTERDYKVLGDPHLTLVEKALELGRTYDSVIGRAYQMGFKSKVGLGDVRRGVWRILFPGADQAA